MLQTSEGETEIVLGNKQLLGIFCVAVILLGVAFAGGYKLGQASKKALSPPPATETGTGGQTHELPAASADQTASSPETETNSGPPLGSRHKKTAEKLESGPAPPPGSEPTAGFLPQPGQSFLQVAAVGRDEAEAIADVLHKKGFRAHAVPKPGNSKIYRVLIGPVRDAADLNTTRESLRRTGFREVIVQRY
jgi:cell division septation protein DedD